MGLTLGGGDIDDYVTRNIVFMVWSRYILTE